ncbi:M15 family metallopeptidase [Sulfitobacter sp. 1A16787]|uniref:M15 family metallopeptidase n=1 Tax=Sulfitobacter sp. 1A16787 TaxID=3368571 RepID=UPI003745822C
MTRDALRVAQEVLAKGAGYKGRIDGLAGSQSLAAAARVPGPRPAGWGAMSSARRVIAAAQMMLAAAGHDPGPVDGYMGQRTEAAATLFLGDAWARPAARDGRPTAWGSEATLARVFGPPGGADCTRGRVLVPWGMVLAWDTSERVTEISCHALVAPSLGRVFEAVADTHKPAEIRALGLHLYGGCYNLRRKRGGSEWSTHAYGVALDFDPLRNRLRWGRDRARLAQEDASKFWRAFEDEGWCSLGREANFDWMHVQAPRP